MTTDQLTIGIDLGGTNILASVVDADCHILARQKVDTTAGEDVEQTARRMHTAASAALAAINAAWASIAAVGIAIPSSVDQASGRLLHAPNLGWQDQPAQPVFEKVFERPVCLDNDVNCGVLAEALLDAGRGFVNVAGFFVGTGTGGGLVINGRLHTGRRGAAAEFGHQIVHYNGRRCGCGHHGCLEAYCSKTGFGRQFKKIICKNGHPSVLSDYSAKELTNVRSKVLAKAYQNGDAVVQQVLNKGARMLGVATANVIAILAPDCIVYGGGVMEALGQELMPVIRQGMADHLFGLGPNDITLKLSELGDDAVPLGAALLTRHATEAC